MLQECFRGLIGFMGIPETILRDVSGSFKRISEAFHGVIGVVRDI